MLRGEVRVQNDGLSQVLGLNDLVTEDEWSQVIVQSYFPAPTSKIFHSFRRSHTASSGSTSVGEYMYATKLAKDQKLTCVV